MKRIDRDYSRDLNKDYDKNYIEDIVLAEEDAELEEVNRNLEKLFEEYVNTYLLEDKQKEFKFKFFEELFGKENIVEQDIYGPEFINAVLQEEYLEYWVYEEDESDNCWHIISTAD